MLNHKALSHFHKKAPPQTFDQILNTPLWLMLNFSLLNRVRIKSKTSTGPRIYSKSFHTLANNFEIQNANQFFTFFHQQPETKNPICRSGTHWDFALFSTYHTCYTAIIHSCHCFYSLINISVGQTQLLHVVELRME